LTIGQMARLSGLTVKALRYYDRVGMITPAAVRAGTGVRHYSADQVGRARLIGRLRAVDLPLREIRRCLDDPEATRQVLTAHRTRLESRATRIAGDLHKLNHLLNDGLEATMGATGEDKMSRDDERELARRLFNAVWDLLETEERSTADDDRMLHMAHASRYHWGQVGEQKNFARGEWQCSRVYAVLRRSEPCLHHARRVLDICVEAGLGDFDLAFAYEALARGHAVAGDAREARAMTERALAAAEDISNPEDRKILLADLETIPGQPRFW
jgi:DNA-binding transcriptional MerR regulator